MEEVYWLQGETILKNKPDSVTFYKSILVSQGTF